MVSPFVKFGRVRRKGPDNEARSLRDALSTAQQNGRETTGMVQAVALSKFKAVKGMSSS